MRLDQSSMEQVTRFVAERIRLCVSERIPQIEMLHGNYNLLARLDDVARDMVLHMDAYVVAMRTERIIVNEQWPLDWVEAVKERWAPRWFLKRWPVRYKVVKIDEQKYGPICPHIHIPDRAQHLEWISRPAH